MLELKNITKSYATESLHQVALNGASIAFRKTEFVSILGPSGSGKTTMLNIIGGLDQYDSGDLIINGTSTKEYKDKDWDAYRNHSIGFVFQSYNLIGHQSILSNVEMALTLSGVPRNKREEMATEALKRVGLGDHIHKKPNQLSGGQMQRVAIARALVNNPDIILADEPTGALDSKTSVQIMDLLKEVAQDRLVIMVTHNPELAKEYSSRIVELRDGVLCSDSNPLEVKDDESEVIKTNNFGKVGMSPLTAMRLSFSNLISKIKRTTLVAVAGSIGIIGISLIMAISNGANSYIQSMEEQTLSEYPLTIFKSTMDLTSLMGVATTMAGDATDDKIHEQQIISGLFGTVQENDLRSLKEHIDSDKTPIKDYVNAIEYSYGLTPYIYHISDNGVARQVSPDNVIDSAGLTTIASLMAGQTTTFVSLPSDESIYKTKYEVVEGKWPENPNELVVILGHGNTLSDLTLYNMGLKDTDKLDQMLESFNSSSTEQLDIGNPGSWEFSEVIGKEFHLVNSAHMYKYDEQVGCWVKISEANETQEMARKGEKLTVVGVARPNADNATPTMTPAIYYTSDLVYKMIETSAKSKVVQEQVANENINVLTGKEFDDKSNDFDMSKLFDFDDGAFDEVFAFDASSVNMDMSGFNSINIGSFNISDYFDADTLKELTSVITEDTISHIFEGVSVDITREKLNNLFQNLYTDFLDSTSNDPSMNLSNMGPAINQYLKTEDAKNIIKETILSHLENGKEAILSSSDFISHATHLISFYLNYATSNDLNPADQSNLAAFMQTPEAQSIFNDMAESAKNAIAQLLTSMEMFEEIIQKLTDGYNEWAAANNAPIAQEIVDAFVSYLKTERAMEIIMKNAEIMIDMETLRNNLDDVAADVGKQISDIVSEQLGDAVRHLASQLSLQIESAIVKAMTSYMSELKNSFDFSTDSLMKVVDANMSAESMKDILTNMLSGTQHTAKSNLKSFGYADIDDPESITFYPKDFETKAGVIQVLEDYNDFMKIVDESKVISYSDVVGSLMSSITDIIDIIGYVLIAFVSVSLVVSSIMIGVITYISVLERRKEIGILRAMGASKRNITQVFNCETIITGFLAGCIGVVMTWVLLIPANAILQYATQQPSIRGYLPLSSAIFLILLSIVLTTIGGLLPSKSAAKQDPVVALRSE